MGHTMSQNGHIKSLLAYTNTNFICSRYFLVYREILENSTIAFCNLFMVVEGLTADFDVILSSLWPLIENHFRQWNTMSIALGFFVCFYRLAGIVCFWLASVMKSVRWTVAADVDFDQVASAASTKWRHNIETLITY